MLLHTVTKRRSQKSFRTEWYFPVGASQLQKLSVSQRWCFRIFSAQAGFSSMNLVQLIWTFYIQNMLKNLVLQFNLTCVKKCFLTPVSYCFTWWPLLLARGNDNDQSAIHYSPGFSKKIFIMSYQINTQQQNNNNHLT